MTSNRDVEVADINALKRFSADARVNQPVLVSKDLVTRMNCYEPGQMTPLHLHPDHDEVVFCIEGRGAVTFPERAAVSMEPGIVVNLPAGLAHRIEAAPDSRMVVVYWAPAQYTSVRLHGETGYSEVRLPGEQPPSPPSVR